MRTKSMKKMTAVFVLMVSMAAAVTGCGQSGNDGEEGRFVGTEDARMLVERRISARRMQRACR